MNIVRLALLIIGCLVALVGLIWAGQGAGIIQYPADSFMISQTPWVYRGLGAAAVGAVLIFVSRRISGQ